jgi:intracellular sulfur oxidation DsrE/DsrF family protein
MQSILKPIFPIISLLFLVACVQQQYKPAQKGFFQQKVVYHVSDIKNVRRALINIKNHLGVLGDKNADIILVTNGSGVLAMLAGAQDEKGAEYSARIHALATRGVKFQVCDISLQARNIDRKQLLLSLTVVPSGVVQVGHLQQQGYGYIRP